MLQLTLWADIDQPVHYISTKLGTRHSFPEDEPHWLIRLEVKVTIWTKFWNILMNTMDTKQLSVIKINQIWLTFVMEWRTLAIGFKVECQRSRSWPNETLCKEFYNCSLQVNRNFKNRFNYLTGQPPCTVCINKILQSSKLGMPSACVNSEPIWFFLAFIFSSISICFCFLFSANSCLRKSSS